MKRIFTLTGVVFLGFIAFTLVKVVRSQENNSRIQEPVVDYTSVDVADSENAHLRVLRGCRYDGQRAKPIEELPPGIDPLPEIDHWLSRLSALPVEKSDAVLTGEVLSAKAYLSNDRTGVYSEFNIRIDSALKDDSHLLATGNSVIAGRAGGAVRFPSGRIQRYGILNQGTPQVGRRYALFLKRSEQDQGFLILTAYELRQGYVFPLDGPDRIGSKTKLAFSAYEGTEESVFLDVLKEAISQRSKAPVETRR